MRKRMNVLSLFVACILNGALTEARAGPVVSATFQMPVRLQAMIDPSGCADTAGPRLTFSGTLALDGLGMDVMFRDNETGRRAEGHESVAGVTFLEAGQGVSVPSQPVTAGAGGNPFLWMQVLDAGGNPVTGAILLGRCDQGVTRFAADFAVPVTVSARLVSDGCYGDEGSLITVEGTIALTALRARFLPGDSAAPTPGPQKINGDAVAEAVVVPSGQVMRLPKRQVHGKTSGNPWVATQFRDLSEDAVSNEVLLGRCVQMSQ